MRVFVAGAAGAIGQHLLPQLTSAGHQVTASTRNPAKAERLRALGAEPAVVDGLDAVAVGEAVARAEPEVVIHQMTALSGDFDLRRFDRMFAVTNKLRTDGTDHLLAAAVAAGARRFIAQSYTGWTNPREGGPVKTEEDPLDPSPTSAQRESLAAIGYLEAAVASADQLDGIVLRYGSFYGPGASDAFVGLIRRRRVPVIGNGAGIWSFLHISDAAAATVCALERGAPGVYNVVDDEPASVAELAGRFFRAVGDGDMDGLLSMLAEDVIVYGDSGGIGPSWPRPITGRDNVSRLLLGIGGQMRQVGITISPAGINGQPGALFLDPDGNLTNVFVLDIADGQVAVVRSVINPQKLRHLGPLADLTRLRGQLRPR